MIVVVPHLSKLTETLRRSCSPTPPHWAGLTSPDRWKPGKILIMNTSWKYFVLYIYSPFLKRTQLNTYIIFFSLHHLLHSITLIEKICAPIIHIPSHEAPPAAQHTWFSYQHVRLSNGRWDDSTFILFYKTYPVQQKYCAQKSFLPSMDCYSKLCLSTVWIEYAALVWRADGGWCVSPLCVDNSIIMDGAPSAESAPSTGIVVADTTSISFL